MVDTKEKSLKIQKRQVTKKSIAFLPEALPEVRKLKVGKNYNLKITGLSSSNLGLNEFTYGFPILIGGLEQTKATLGDFVQIQVLKIEKTSSKKYAIAKIIKVLTKVKKSAMISAFNTSELLGKRYDVQILKKGTKGTYIGESTDNSKKKFILNACHVEEGTNSLSLGQKVSVQVTRVKQNYCFAKLDKKSPSLVNHKSKLLNNLPKSIKEGSKFTLVLPNTKGKAQKVTRYLKHIVIKINTAKTVPNSFPRGASQASTTLLFVKPLTGAKLGDKVQVQIVRCAESQKTSILIGKIITIQPISSIQKKRMLKTTLKQMLKSGMHFGEKAIKCNSRMLKKNYVWMSNKSLKAVPTASFGENAVGACFARSFQEKKPLIKKGRNILNLLKTNLCLNKALAQIAKYAVKGKTFLFVGTKKAASGLIARASLFSKKAFFVNTRWLGGMLTNWKTIFKSISKIRPILKEKQLIIKDILEKRENIKKVLIEKAFLFKKKSQFVLKKGRQLLNNKKTLSISDKALKLSKKRKEFIQKGQVLFEKRQLLLQKRKQVILQSQALYAKYLILTNNSKEYFNKATLLRQKLRELKSLLVVSQQLQTVQQTAKTQNQELYTVSYNQLKRFQTNSANNTSAYLLPNPPKDILNKMVLFIKQKQGLQSAAMSPGPFQALLDTSSTSKKTEISKIVVSTKLLSQFSSFAPSIKLSIKLLLTNLKQIQEKLILLQDTLKVIALKMQDYLNIKNQIQAVALTQIQQNFVSQRNIIRVIKRKLKQISSQKRLIQFLPKLRFLPTPTKKIALTVQVLMKKIVDPILKYPMDSIYDTKLTSQSKKVAAMRKKKWQRLEKYFGGIANMTQINSKQIRNNVAIIIGQQEEMNAVRECQKLGIKMFHMVDTNCNPNLADHFIPANDDSRNSIQLVLTQFLTRIRLAQKFQKYASKSKTLRPIFAKKPLMSAKKAYSGNR
jgi:small subunit ribosomal protein S2